MSCFILLLLLLRIELHVLCDADATNRELATKTPGAINSTAFGTREYRRKREIDEADVINKFEIERERFDLERHSSNREEGLAFIAQPPEIFIPNPFGKDGANNVQRTVERAKPIDVEHVVSESGRSYRDSSGVNWFFSSKSFYNVSNFSSEHQTQHRFVENLRKGKKLFVPPKRQNDQNHVVSQVPGSRTARGTTADDVRNPNPFGSGIGNLNSEAQSQMPVADDPASKPNVTTRYVLLQSGRVIAYNVTTYPASSKPQDPVPFFGGRIRPKSGAGPFGNNQATTEVPQAVTKKIPNNLNPINRFQHPKSLERIDWSDSGTTSTPIQSQPAPVPEYLPRPHISPQEFRDRFKSVITTTSHHAKSQQISKADGNKVKKHHNSLIPSSLEEPFILITFDSLKKSHKDDYGDSYEYDTSVSLEEPERPRLNVNERRLPGFATVSSTFSEYNLHSRNGYTTKSARMDITARPPPGFSTYAVTKSANSKDTPGQEDDQDTRGVYFDDYDAFVTEQTPTKGTLPPPATKKQHEFVRIVTAKPLVFSTNVGNERKSVEAGAKSTRVLPLGKRTTSTPGNSRKPRFREYSHPTPTMPSTWEENITPSRASTGTSKAAIVNPNPTRTPRQNKFHFRNSVSFQLMPPGALADRRSLSSASAANGPDRNANQLTKEQTTKAPGAEEFVPVFFFEPTRRKFSGSDTEAIEDGPIRSHQPIFVTRIPNSPNRRPKVLQPIRQNENPTPFAIAQPQSVLKSKPASSTPRNLYQHNTAITQSVPKEETTTTAPEIFPTTFSTTTRRIAIRTRLPDIQSSGSSTWFPATQTEDPSTVVPDVDLPKRKFDNRVGRHFKQTVVPVSNLANFNSLPDDSSRDDISSARTTKKPFRVYYFEPKRRKSKRKQVVQVSTEKSPEITIGTIGHPPAATATTMRPHVSTSTRRPPRQLATARPKQVETATVTTPPRSRSATRPTLPKSTRQPRQLADRPRQDDTSTGVRPPTTMASTTARKPRRKSPFIQHKPNVKSSTGTKQQIKKDTELLNAPKSTLRPQRQSPSIEYLLNPSVTERRFSTVVPGELSVPLVKALQGIAQSGK